MLIDAIYFVAEPLRVAHRTCVRLATRFLRASYLAPLTILTSGTPHIALAAPKTFSDLANTIVSILDSATGLLIVAGIVIYFWGISRNVMKMRDEGGQKMWNFILWGIGVIFLMVSIWGILELLQNTLFSGNQFSPNTGTPAANFQVNQAFE